jgi:hypothetical protein
MIAASAGNFDRLATGAFVVVGALLSFVSSLAAGTTPCNAARRRARLFGPRMHRSSTSLLERQWVRSTCSLPCIRSNLGVGVEDERRAPHNDGVDRRWSSAWSCHPFPLMPSYRYWLAT